ncbi:MAG: hypothetical protein K1X29_02490 [Bdellovibrionales bacterium]|nr:hypothetical protein [Bdellovibrionales bacterium]
MKTQNCRLVSGGIRIGVLKEKWYVNDGVGIKVENLPQSENIVEWSSLRLKSLKGRNFIEMLIWSKEKGEARIQLLHWIVVEILGNSEVNVGGKIIKEALKVGLNLRLNEVVQRRRQILGAKNQETKDSVKISYQYDNKDQFGLVNKGQKIHWYAKSNGKLLRTVAFVREGVL